MGQAKNRGSQEERIQAAKQRAKDDPLHELRDLAERAKHYIIVFDRSRIGRLALDSFRKRPVEVASPKFSTALELWDACPNEIAYLVVFRSFGLTGGLTVPAANDESLREVALPKVYERARERGGMSGVIFAVAQELQESLRARAAELEAIYFGPPGSPEPPPIPEVATMSEAELETVLGHDEIPAWQRRFTSALRRAAASEAPTMIVIDRAEETQVVAEALLSQTSNPKPLRALWADSQYKYLVCAQGVDEGTLKFALAANDEEIGSCVATLIGERTERATGVAIAVACVDDAVADGLQRRVDKVLTGFAAEDAHKLLPDPGHAEGAPFTVKAARDLRALAHGRFGFSQHDRGTLECLARALESAPVVQLPDNGEWCKPELESLSPLDLQQFNGAAPLTILQFFSDDANLDTTKNPERVSVPMRLAIVADMRSPTAQDAFPTGHRGAATDSHRGDSGMLYVFSVDYMELNEPHIPLKTSWFPSLFAARFAFHEPVLYMPMPGGASAVSNVEAVPLFDRSLEHSAILESKGIDPDQSMYQDIKMEVDAALQFWITPSESIEAGTSFRQQLISRITAPSTSPAPHRH